MMEMMKSCVGFAVFAVLVGCLTLVALGSFHPVMGACMAAVAGVELLFVALGIGGSPKENAPADSPLDRAA